MNANKFQLKGFSQKQKKQVKRISLLCWWLQSKPGVLFFSFFVVVVVLLSIKLKLIIKRNV